MKRFYWGISVGALLVLGVMWFQPSPAQAATPAAATSTATTSVTPDNGFNIITSPLPIKISTPPGKTVTTELRMKNLGNQTENIKVGLMKFGATGDLGEPDLFSLTPKDTYASWVHFSPSEFEAQPNVWQSVTMTINVPKNADLGYYLAVTFSRAADISKPGNAALKGAVATLVLLNVDTPNEKRALSLISVSSQKKLYEYLPASLTVKLRNTGNIYLAPVGNIFITHNGKTISTIDFNDAGASVLPNSNRVITTQWISGFPLYKPRVINGKTVLDSHGQPKEDLKYDFTQINKLRIGKYTAKVLVVYDNGTNDVPLESSVDFWVVPWKILIVVIVIVLLILFGVFGIGRTLYRRARGITGKRKASANKLSKKPKDSEEE